MVFPYYFFFKRVHTGLPDDKTYPLSTEFTLSRDDDMIEFNVPSKVSVISADDEFNINEENIEIKPTIHQVKSNL